MASLQPLETWVESWGPSLSTVQGEAVGTRTSYTDDKNQDKIQKNIRQDAKISFELVALTNTCQPLLRAEPCGLVIARGGGKTDEEEGRAL